jgi:hypothetical protein
MKIYLGTWPHHKEQQRALTNVGINNRFCSFCFFYGQREDLLRDVVVTGLADYVEEKDEPLDEIPWEIFMD